MKTMKYKIFLKVQSTTVNSMNSTTFLKILNDHSFKNSIILSMFKFIKHLDTWVPSEEFPFIRDTLWQFWLNGSVLHNENVRMTMLYLKATPRMELAHLYIPKPKLRAVIWATSNKIVVIWTPCNIRNAISMSF